MGTSLAMGAGAAALRYGTPFWRGMIIGLVIGAVWI
jgi:hypothetical protein